MTIEREGPRMYGVYVDGERVGCAAYRSGWWCAFTVGLTLYGGQLVTNHRTRRDAVAEVERIYEQATP